MKIATVRPREPQAGQIIVLFALFLVAIAAMAGLLIDGGRAWATQQQAQAAADTGALAAAQAASDGASHVDAAHSIAADNDFDADLVDCSGATQAGQGVIVNLPPASGPHAGDSGFVEVLTTRAMNTTFAGVAGFPCWLVSGRAVASILSSAVATCNFCALSDWDAHTGFLVDNGADLRVDGGIVVNQNTWYSGTEAVNRCGSNPCTAATCSSWNGLPSDQRIRMCGNSIYVAHSGGLTTSLVSARTIQVNGGWQTARNQDHVHADELAAGCVSHPQPLAWLQPSNVCIGMPQIADPLNDGTNPGNIVTPPDPDEMTVPVAGANGCPIGARVPTGTLVSPAKLVVTGAQATLATICPGLYFGGFSAFGDYRNLKVTMVPGVYFMVGGGFQVTGTASIDGSAGVMIYNSSGSESFSTNTLPLSAPPPICDSGISTCLAPLATVLTTSDTTLALGQTVTYTLTLTAATGQPVPTGTVDFYDGDQIITGCDDRPLGPGPSSTKVKATCATSYQLFGTRWITGVYSGDARYRPVAAAPVKEMINPANGLAAEVVDVCTGPPCGATWTCTMADPCSTVVLHAPTSGPYAGMLIFQARSSGMGIRMWPYAGAAACTGSWMTDGVPPNADPVPAPCGAMGGLSGTIYAPHQSTGASDWDAVVNLRSSGLSNLQIIAAEISLSYDSNTRLAYRPELFANGKIHLVE